MSHGRSFADLPPISVVTGPVGALPASPPIDLTLTPEFRLGSARVRPSTCEVIVTGGAIRLQPRVMQVLVALARARGEVVSRGLLVESCWGDVVVGDDSLNRCIQMLRQLSQAEALGAFVIETVPRLGYRLSAVETAPPVEAPDKAAPRRYQAILAVGLCAIALLAVAAALLIRAWPARWVIERSEPLVSSPLIELYPAISPDGTTLAYSAGSDRFNRRIFLKRLSGGEPIQLTSDGLDDVSPTWSRDGSRIAYAAYRPGEPCRIMVVAVPAGLATQVARCRTAERTQLVWNGSANSLFFVDAATMGASLAVFSLDLTDGRVAPIDHPPAGVDDLAAAVVSPDGRLLSIVRSSAKASDNRLMIHDLHTGSETWLTHAPPSVNATSWAEDSRSVFVDDDVPGSSELWSYPIDGGPGQRLFTVTSPVNFGRLASGPGGLLAVEYNTMRYNLARRSPAGSVDIIDPANDRTWSPAFGPDGTLAMASNRAGEQGVWQMRPQGRSRLLLSVKRADLCCMAWSPDGADFAYIVDDGPLSIRVVTADGEEVARIRVPGMETGLPAWMADGRSLVFPVRDAGGWRLWRAELARPDRPAPITGYGWACVRADGDVLYGVKPSEPGIWRIGTPSVKLTNAFSLAHPGDWAIFRHQIIFADQTRLDQPRLLSIPVEGGPARPFADLPHAAYGMEFTIEPRSGVPVYIDDVGDDADIELFHLTRR